MRSGVAPRGEGVVWFLYFLVLLPVLAYGGFGGWSSGWPGVGLLLVLYVVGVVVLRLVFTRLRRGIHVVDNPELPDGYVPPSASCS